MTYGFLICENCARYFKLEKKVTASDFNSQCSCGGRLRYKSSLPFEFVTDEENIKVNKSDSFGLIILAISFFLVILVWFFLFPPLVAMVVLTYIKLFIIAGMVFTVIYGLIKK